MTEEYQGPVQLNSPTPKESLGFWKSVETGAKDSALDIVKGLAYADTLQNKGLSWAMREYRTALGVQQPTYLERHLYLENNVMNHLGEWATVHTTEDELHQQNEFGSFIGQAIPFLAGGIAAKGLEGTAAGARALAAEGAAKDVETEAAETAAYNKSALKSGIVHRYVSYNASMLPVDAGQSVSFNKKGQMSLNGKQFAESTAFSQIPFGVFEGAGMAFRQTFLKGSTIDLAGSKKYETEKKKDEGVTQNPEMEVKGDSIEEPAPDEESDPVKVSKSTQEEEAGESTQETFDRLFTPEQQKALDREATGEPLEGTTGHQIANDVEHAKESLPYIYHAISSNVGNEYGPISLKRAAISRFGILIKGIRRSIRDVQTMLDVKEAERKMKDYKTEKGSRRFYFSNKLQEYLLKNKHKISASRLAEINEQDAALFDAEPWTIKGAQIEHAACCSVRRAPACPLRPGTLVLPCARSPSSDQPARSTPAWLRGSPCMLGFDATSSIRFRAIRPVDQACTSTDSYPWITNARCRRGGAINSRWGHAARRRSRATSTSRRARGAPMQ